MQIQPNQAQNKGQKGYPEFRYLLVLDFQATCDDNVKLQPCSQIIQFPIRIIIETFHYYVKPTIHTKLTKFCTELTGITQEQVDQGKVLEDVLKELDIWMNKLFNRENFLKDGENKNFTTVTCGDWDLITCIRQEAAAKKIQYADYLKQYINIKKYFDIVLGWDKQNKKCRGMMDMLEVLKIKHQGKHHSGIDDVTNICQICISLIKDFGAKFEKKHVVTVKEKKPKKQYIQKK